MAAPHTALLYHRVLRLQSKYNLFINYISRFKEWHIFLTFKDAVAVLMSVYQGT